jgi:quercetin dioxygenase-like cupin family protein
MKPVEKRRVEMNVKQFLTPTTWVIASLILLKTNFAVSQESPPKENKGMKAPVIASLDLGPEIDGMQGRQLRMRKFTLEPGGIIGIHPHKDRPSTVYLLQGTLIERRQGGYVKEHHEGEAWAEGKATTHWVENRGTEPAVFIGVDIFNQQ